MVQQPEEGPDDLERFVDAPEPGAGPEPAAELGLGRAPPLANGHAAAGVAPGAAASNGAPLQSRGKASGVQRRGVDLGGLAGGSAHNGYDSDDSGGDGLGAAASVSSEEGSGSEDASGGAERGEGAAVGGNGDDRGGGSAEGRGGGAATARRRVQDGAYDMQKRCAYLQQAG